MCEEVCPVDAIELTPRYEVISTSRKEMIFDKEKLLELYDLTIEDKPM
jgi:NADH-quinone oxidoreductase subunit I